MTEIETHAGTPLILLVEDDAGVAGAVVKYLEKSGFAVHLCHRGSEALEYVETVRPSAIITDIHLPDINGLVLSQKFRATLGDVLPIIVLSGDTSMETLKSLSHVGATYFLNKPVNFQLLHSRLNDFLAAATGR